MQSPHGTTATFANHRAEVGFAANVRASGHGTFPHPD
jgi:hypothetical protein